MTRSSKLALVTLLAGLLSLASVTAVSADHLCTSYAQEHCEQMAAANDSALFRIVEVTGPVHFLSANGIAQEHFEAMSVAQPDLFRIAPSAPTATYLPTYAPEHYEEITTVDLNKSGSPSRTVQFAQEHYEDMTSVGVASN